MGQVAVGTLADLVLWKPENFGSKPEMVLKSGVIVYSQVCTRVVSRKLRFNDALRWAMPTPPFPLSNHSSPNPCGVPNQPRRPSTPFRSYQKSRLHPGSSLRMAWPNALKL